jgi:phasin family protein
MVDPKVPKTEASADKASAAASEGVSAKPAPAEQKTVADSEAVAAVADAPEAEPDPTAAGEEQVVPIELAAKAKRPSKPRKAAVPAPGPRVMAKVASAKPVSAKKPGARKPATVKAIPKARPAAKPAPATKANVSNKAKAKPAKPIISNPIKTHTISQLKDKIMATTTTQSPDFAKGFQDAIADMQIKAKTAFEKSTASFGDVSEFAKGNVEALVESGKILAAGVQELGTTYVSESRSAFETLSADVKELASSKSPTDFLKLQSELVRRNLDAAVAAGSKNSEAMLKLVNEVFAPLSGRFSLAVDKIKKAA